MSCISGEDKIDGFVAPASYYIPDDLYWWEILQGIVCLTCEVM